MGFAPTERTRERPRIDTSTAPHSSAPHPSMSDGSSESPALDENVQAIQRWEQAALHSRTTAERLSDGITRLAGSGPVQLAHVAWFAVWIAINTQILLDVQPFDPFPFPLLTTIVSLEAIFIRAVRTG